MQKFPASSPCLILTKEEIYLVQRPFSSLADTSKDSIITMRQPLHPGLWHPLLKSHDRLCYFAQISELGAFVIASPYGRAGVFTLYRTRGEDAYAQYGFKLEYLLPYEQDNNREASNVHGVARLLGIAVAPVQGKPTVVMLSSMLLLTQLLSRHV